MKKLFIAILMFPVFAFAQKNYTIHKVQPKETLYSLARQYNMHPRELATFNNLDINSGLAIGQEIKIPTKPGSKPIEQKPVTPVAKVALVEPAKPAETADNASGFHIVGKKETLYAISKKYNVTIADLKAWNNLSGDGVSEGQKLIVAGNAVVAKQQKQSKPEVVVPEKPEPVASDIEKQKAELAKQKKMIEEQEQKIKEAEAKQQQELADKQAEEQKKKEAEEKRKEMMERKEADKKAIEEIAQKNVPVTPASSSGKFDGGYFKDQYTNSKNINETGTAGVFKSTSGWEDGKYYCLHNSAPIGSIIKISNAAGGKFIYAKVLDVIPDLKQNANLIVRLSSAAAAELGQSESNFGCVINY